MFLVGVRRSRCTRPGKSLADILDDITALIITEVPIGPREVSGVPCQDWVARDRGPDASGWKPRIRLCLGVEDQRLMELGMADATWTFSDWNGTIEISFPSGAPSS